MKPLAQIGKPKTKTKFGLLSLCFQGRDKLLRLYCPGIFMLAMKLETAFNTASGLITLENEFLIIQTYKFLSAPLADHLLSQSISSIFSLSLRVSFSNETSLACNILGRDKKKIKSSLIFARLERSRN